jgi:uncharacterized Ntn-hydrolase superfamily protein
MTFSLLGRCARTGQLGVAVTTSDIAVGARVPHAVGGLAVAVTQHRTDPRLGPHVLELLRSGRAPSDAVEEVAASTPHRDWRQLAVLDANGAAAVRSGRVVTPIVAELPGEDCLAVGNMLVSDDVGPAMVEAFAADPEQPLATRLLAGIHAAHAAGGETGQLRSAALLVVADQPFPFVDLRVDAADDPLTALDELWRTYEPWATDFVQRALDPDRATGRPDPHRAGPSSTTTYSSRTETG